MILRIKPLYTPRDEESFKEIYYPMWVYIFEYTVKRRLFGDIKGGAIILVDGISGRAYLADAFPDIERVEAEQGVLKPQIGDAKSDAIAKDKVETFLFRKFAYLRFSYSLVSKVFAYKLLWARKEEEHYYLLDSVTGDEIEVYKIDEESKEVIDDTG
ncbi:hypothetical protein [Thermococcus sp.]|uniref:hypothetical protein n=1 Tax=Thermococcus sp. TaxID=35749 RepID=UPI00262E5C53|nr:hypothetical protein [Thermococcus sp.]